MGRMEQNEAEDDDDAIILTGCGQISQWIWPEHLTKCQVRTCHSNIKSRREAIKHFRDTHANVSILCPLCDKPIHAPSPYQFKRHFHRSHPNCEIPFVFNGSDQSAMSKGQTKQVCDHVCLYFS